MRKINSLFKAMFPGTDFKTISRKEGVLVTRSGLPLKGLLLPNVESMMVLGKVKDKYAGIFGIERAFDRTLLMHRLEPNKGYEYLIKALN